MTRMQEARSGREGGQILAVFALAMVTIVAMTGLVVDGGFTFVQRREQQNVVDAAAISAAYAYGWNSICPGETTTGAGATAATTAAQTLATANGYANGSGGVSVNVSFDAACGAGRHITVSISKPHQNYFAGIVGMSTWVVSTTATTLAGRPNAAIGAMPIIFNALAFDLNAPGVEVTFNEPAVGSNDIPITSDTFNWTMYCDQCNGNTASVASLIDGGGQLTSVSLDDTITPLNAGAHTADFTSLSAYIGTDFPVPIVNDLGVMVGWATFHLTGSTGGSTKTISGWFESGLDPSSMTISDSVSSGGDYGAYIARLVN